VNEVHVVYQKKNFGLVTKTLQSIPPTREMVMKSRFDLKKMLDQRSSLAYPLLQWQVIVVVLTVVPVLFFVTLRPHYNVVIRCCLLYRVITMTASY